VEIKTLNHRYLEISAKLPESVQIFEKEIKNFVHDKIKRGRVNFSLNVESNNEDVFEIGINKKMAQRYYSALKSLQKEFRLDGSINLEQILSFPEILEFKRKKHDLTKCWPKVKLATQIALYNLIKSRKAEGKFMQKDLLKRARAIENILLKIKKRLPIVLKNQKKRFLKRIRKSQIKKIDNEKLELELTSYIQYCDIDEEVTRISAHVSNFKKTLTSNSEIGKKMDFIAQELSREANTIA
ncbi:unnamed protein product, partial [marine sediment metagenome]